MTNFFYPVSKKSDYNNSINILINIKLVLFMILNIIINNIIVVINFCFLKKILYYNERIKDLFIMITKIQ